MPLIARTSRHHCRSALLATLVLGLFPAGTSVAEPTAYERMARAELVLWVETVEGTLRLAECKVLGVLKGKYDPEKIFIAFRSDNMNRERWRDRIIFEAGKHSILLLAPVRDHEMEIKAPDRFRLVSGFHGKIDLPPEGAEAQIRAFRRMGEILEMDDIHLIWKAHRELLHEVNPYLVETGFAEVLKFRLGKPEMIPLLMEYLDSPHDRFRVSSLKVLAQVFQRARRRQEPLGSEDHVVAGVLTVAMEDPAPPVRVAAVNALHAYGRPDILAALQQVARDDPSQDVRYAATLSVYRLTRRGVGSAVSGDLQD